VFFGQGNYPLWTSKQNLGYCLAGEFTTLFDMLTFHAQNWYHLSRRLSGLDIILGIASDRMAEKDWQGIGAELEQIESDCKELGLALSAMHANRAFKYWKDNDRKRCGEAIRELHLRIQDELSQNTFYWVPKERETFLHQVIDFQYLEKLVPSIIDEFFAASRSYIYGENTACIFHLMRVVDFGLHKVAKSLGIGYSAHNWKMIGDDIRKKMEQKYQDKTEEWRKSEPFYAGVLTDIGAIARGHRNPTLHELERTYDDREARYMITVVSGFMLHVGKEMPESEPTKLDKSSQA
jgi:hypothetical protein